MEGNEWRAGDYWLGSSSSNMGARGCSSWIGPLSMPMAPVMHSLVPNRIIECGHCGYQTVIGDLSKAGLTVLKCPECAGPLKV
jgi:hypothetical protein